MVSGPAPFLMVVDNVDDRVFFFVADGSDFSSYKYALPGQPCGFGGSP